jgi:spermidine/putrescine transport system substrate-binding protein
MPNAGLAGKRWRSRTARAVLIVVAAIGASSLLGCPSGDGNKPVLAPAITILNWADYIDMDVVGAFETEFGVKVTIEPFENEDEMIALIQSNPGKYDLTVASGSIVKMMIDLGLVAKIDRELIPNAALVDAEFLSPPYDPTNEYTVPYLWGTTGIAVNRRFVKDEEIGWGVLFDGRYAGKIEMLNDSQEVFAAALKHLGYSINSRDTRQLEEAAKLLMAQKKIIRGYFPTTEIQDHLVDTTCWVAYLYSGDTLLAAEKNPDITYYVPESGAPIWTDNWVIPATSKNREAAEAFIDYVLTPENIAKISNYTWYANAVSSSRRYLDKELSESRVIYLPRSLLSKCEPYAPLDEATNRYLNRVWYDLIR